MVHGLIDCVGIIDLQNEKKNNNIDLKTICATQRTQEPDPALFPWLQICLVPEKPISLVITG